MHVIYAFAEVTLVFEDFVKAEEAINFVLFFQQFLLKRFYKWFKNLCLICNWAEGRSLHTRSSIIIRIYPQTGDAAQVHQTHVEVAETQISPMYRSRILLPRLLIQIDNALNIVLSFVKG